jgi:cytidine deaminase
VKRLAAPTNAHWAALTKAARDVRKKAYAPYSNYLVGAALMDDTGAIFIGCNVENASYGLTVCAERNAIGSAVAQGSKGRFIAAVVTTGGAHPGTPCGMCRQVLGEFARGKTFPVRCLGEGKARIDTDVLALLPLGFDASVLEKGRVH